jgi:hypothetical protein
VIDVEPRGDERGFLARRTPTHLANRCGSFPEMLPPARAAPSAQMRSAFISAKHLPRSTHGRLPEAYVEQIGATLATARTSVVSGDSHLLGHAGADEGLQMF